MARNVQTEEAIRAVLRGDTDNLILVARDAAVGASGVVVLRLVDYLAGLGLPPEFTLSVGGLGALLVWRELRDRGYLVRFGVSPKVVAK